MPDIPDPEYDDPKEVYAFFGLAYYQAAVLEQGVINLAVAITAQEIEGVTTGDLKSLFSSFEDKTFGQVVHIAKTKFQLPEDLENDLNVAREKRNHLAHKFFAINAENHMWPEGRKKMIEELIEILSFIQNVDIRMDDYWINAWKVFGVTKEWVQQETKRLED